MEFKAITLGEIIMEEWMVRNTRGTKTERLLETRSVHLYAAYKRWCKDNLENPVAPKSFSHYLRENEVKYGIQYSKHALDNQRGFRHILVLIDPNKPGALDDAFFEEQQNQAPYAPFLP